MKIDIVEKSVGSSVGSHRYRKRRRPLVGPTGSPFLDETLLSQTKSCKWFRSNQPNIQEKAPFSK